MSADLGAILKAAYPQVVARLARVLGDMDRATDATQDALVIALKKWRVDGIPREPVAWLVTVGRNRAIDGYRRDARVVSIDTQLPLAEDHLEPTRFVADEIALSELEDDLLRLVFTCCHPALTPPAQITLVLKVVLGLSVEEIARALLVSLASIDKRITRAKARLKASDVDYLAPGRKDIPERIDTVLKAIYLLFNEGYSRLGDDHLARHRLIDEALRLGRMVTRAVRHDPEARSLLALMLLSAARIPARLDDEGVFVPLDAQDRERWDAGMIREGVALIDSVYAARHPPGAYQIQAAISAIHSGAPSSETTDWRQIVALYDKLMEYDRSPVVPVNRAVALAFAGNHETAHAALEALRDEPALARYQPLYAALAFVQERLGDAARAREAYARAIELADSAAQKVYLKRRLARLG